MKEIINVIYLGTTYEKYVKEMMKENLNDCQKNHKKLISERIEDSLQQNSRKNIT